MNRSSLVRALLALVVLSLSGFFVLTSSPTLGLDLRGGAQIVLEAQDTDTVTADAEATDRAIEVLRRRVDALGVSEPTLTRSGENRVIVELPGISDPEEASEAIGRTAQLTFHEVLGVAQTPPAEGEEPEAETGEQVLVDEQGGPIRVGPQVMTGESVGDAEGVLNPQNARTSVLSGRSAMTALSVLRHTRSIVS